MAKYDVVVIGSGPGGYVAALRAGALGLKTAIVERYNSLGGTCLNVGCIPSKALLDSSEHYHDAKSKFGDHGIRLENLKPDIEQMIKRKEQVVSQTVQGIDHLMKKQKVEVYHGHASFKSKSEIHIKKDEDEDQSLEAEKFIIATGSKPATVPGVEVDKKRIITSTEALNMKEIPKTMTVIGGGIIGLELGSVYARLGTKVEVVEYADSLIPTMDKELGKELEKSLKKLGAKIYKSHKVTGVSSTKTKTKTEAENKKGEKVNFEGEYCLVAVGRQAFTRELGLENIGVELQDNGKIPVNDDLQTSAENIYAIGDVIDGQMLAHKAEDEGIAVAERLAGQKPHINYLLIPSVVYTWPEVAGVGYTEEELKEKGYDYVKGNFPFRASGRARASGDLEGFVKVLSDKETDEILGVHMIGPRIADMIAQAVTAMEYRASAEDIARICHAHPTYTEAFKEASMAASYGSALHI